MRISRRSLLGYSAALASVPIIGRARAQEKPIRVGVLFDLSGPFAAAGSVACAIGTQTAIDLTNERGGVLGKYKVEAVNADSQSKPEVGINEAVRLVNQEKLDIVVGIYSSASAVPIAAKLETEKKILWITTAVATSVLKDKNFRYVFRAQIHSDQYGEAGVGFIADNAKAKLGMEVKDVKVAIIYEDGPYGTGVADADEANCKAKGMQIALKEAYSAAAPDLSSLVTKLRRARPDVIYHVGYNPDITLFLRQGREAGLKFKMLIGNGAGYSQIDKLRETFKSDVDFFCNVDPVPAQLLDAKTLGPGLGDLVKIMVDRYVAKTGAKDVPPHTSMGFNQTWILLQHVMPIAIQKFGGTDAEAIRKAALEVDIPVGGTIQGYGVKFFPPGTPMSGQNERSTPVVTQYTKDATKVVWPNAIRTAEPVLPLPGSSPYSMS
ncbi:MAG: ABC transporter substrate-binding protein [Proteobacteria bacterium]|nr:ABC transporter substrate-binding protein [Pseudomonadota bacterium]